MMYPFMTLNDNTEITHSNMEADGTVKVYIETPVAGGFHNAWCILPEYKWEEINGYSGSEIEYFQEIIGSTAHLILRFSQDGGFENAANL